MVIYLAVLVLALTGNLYNVNKSKHSRKKYIFFIFGAMILVSALRSYTIGIDLKNQYYILFIRVSQMNWSEISKSSYDVGYVVFNKIVSMFTTDPQWFIAIQSIIVIGITGWFILKHSEDVAMSTFLFIANNTWFMYMNVLRQALAISVFLIAFLVWENKKLGGRRYLICIILYGLAVSFHSSAALMIIVPIFEHIKFGRKQIFASGLISIAAFLLYEKIIDLTSRLIGFRRDYSSFYQGTVAGGSAINLNSLYGIIIYLFFFLVAYYSLVHKKKSSNVSVQYSHKSSLNSEIQISLLMYMTLFLIICKILVWRFSIIGRMAYYFIPFTWILVPKAISAYSLKGNKRNLRFTIYCVLTMAFLWIGYHSAAELYGTVPYKFFWN